VRDVTDGSKAQAHAASDFKWPETGACVLGEHQCSSLLAQAGLPMAPGIFVPAGGDLLDASRRIGYPVALKGVAGKITHRAAAGLVALNVREDAVASTKESFRQHANAAGVALDGIYVQRMTVAGVELIVGAFRDPLFGVMISCGAGGTFTELLDDVQFARAPLDAAAARALVSRLRVATYAMKRTPTLDLDAPARFIARFSELASTVPWREFALEVNPIIWTTDATVTGVDSLAVITQP
jgi:succinyl-CoA synthetase beta subunit